MLSEFAQGSTIIVDKPLNWTSFDVVNKIRWNLKTRLKVKNIKVGHAGTLDPLATGVLVICIGKHTKEIDKLMIGAKKYTGTILLGKTTPSYDLETEFEQSCSTKHLTDEMIQAEKEHFIGELMQIPPIFSAKQVDGKRAYELAREGKEFELKANAINVYDLSLNASDLPNLKFEIECSKGTYIRSFAHDIGKKLKVGGTLVELRRTQSGDQKIEDSKSVEEWIEFIQNSPL